ncbi:hypothetical protein V6N12_045421 [Hibiscus sabdariffa]|uniref:Uncharacterized protein n=1 Tax=Hibiscus sabdariffa TaxID=183260 RepID=A0ABR2G2Y9_9ROSI
MEGANKEEGSLEEVEKMKGSSSESDAAKDNANQPSINEGETRPFSTRVSPLGGSKDQRRDESLTGNQQVSDKEQEALDNETKPSTMKVIERPDPIEDNCCDKCCDKYCCIL